MFVPAAVLLFALGPATVIFDGRLEVPRSRARGIPVKVERPTYLYAKFEVREPKAEVRAALLTAAGVHAFREGEPHELLAATPYTGSGEFRFLVMRPGDYYVLIDNRYDAQALLSVHAVVTGREDPSLPGTLPAARRRWIVAISLLLFGMVAGWSGWRLRGVIR